MTVHRLDLRVRVSEGDPGGWKETELLVLVDGREVLADGWGGMGHDPDTLLGVDSPLVPTDRPHDAIVQRCGCGIEGCGALIVRIRRDGGTVVWDRFRDGAAHDFRGRPVKDLDEFRFDVQQYLEEVRRADADRGWEWPERTAARLVREQLRAGNGQRASGGWSLDWVAPGSAAGRTGRRILFPACRCRSGRKVGTSCWGSPVMWTTRPYGRRRSARCS
jgi:hypothetical protein